MSRPTGVEEKAEMISVRLLRSSSNENPYKEKDITKIGTWNVRKMLQHGKAENVVREMSKGSINILGLCETRYAKEKDLLCEGYRFIYSGAEKTRKL